MTREEQDKFWAEMSENGKKFILQRYNWLKKQLSLAVDIPTQREYQSGINEWEEMYGSHNLKPSLTYEDVVKELFMEKRVYYFDWDEPDKLVSAIHCKSEKWYKSPLNCTSQRQGQKLKAINKLLNVAKFLNKNEDGSDLVPNFNDKNQLKWYLYIDYLSDEQGKIMIDWKTSFKSEIVYFRTKEIAEQAVQILGEDVVRIALMTEY